MSDVKTPAEGEEELRAKYNQKEREEAADKGQAMEGGSYPIKDQDDLEKAIHAVGRGGSDHDAIRKHVIARAKALSLSKLIPENWAADGSLKEEDSLDTGSEDRAEPTAQDNVVQEALSEAKAALQKAHDAQAADPDKETDPDDLKVSDALQKAMSATADAVSAQAVDSTPEPRRRNRKPRHRAVQLDREIRYFVASDLEIRKETDSNEITIIGEPIKYDVPYTVRDAFGEFQETMRRGCATELLKRGVDCRFLLNHEGLPMARTSAGTLNLWDTAKALKSEVKLDARQHVSSDFAIAVERGDITQMSVGMIVGRDAWGEAEGRETRDVEALEDLLDVSGVTYPASPTTNIAVAKRMALEVPVESRARMRRLEVDLRSGNVSPEELAEGLAIFQGHDERAGKVLSGTNKDKVATAIGALMALHEASGGDPQDFVPSPAEPAVSTEDGTALSADAQNDPGESMRSEPRISLAETRRLLADVTRTRPQI